VPVAADYYFVSIDPTLKRWVAKGHDCCLMRVLDKGNLRVLSSILAQSVALDFYNARAARWGCRGEAWCPWHCFWCLCSSIRHCWPP